MAIKNRTYRNFLIVYNKVKAKGYKAEEAWNITDRIFTEFEQAPEGLPIESRIDLIIKKED